MLVGDTTHSYSTGRDLKPLGEHYNNRCSIMKYCGAVCGAECKQMFVRALEKHVWQHMSLIKHTCRGKQGT